MDRAKIEEAIQDLEKEKQEISSLLENVDFALLHLERCTANIEAIDILLDLAKQYLACDGVPEKKETPKKGRQGDINFKKEKAFRCI